MARSRREDGGFVLVWMALLLLVLMAMAGFAVDIWRWWYTAQHTQRAADAGALAGAVYLPGDFGRAESTAVDAASANGYDAADVAVETGTRDNQLEVEVSETVDNFFVGLLGLDDTTITRRAVAEYQGPLAMGSPVNQLGNDPFGNQSDPTVAPRFWLNVAAPDATTQSGDRHQAGSCASSADNCVGGTNIDYEEDGYFFVVDVRSVSGGQSLRIQAYDPGFYFVGDACGSNLFNPSNGTDQGYINNLVAMGIADAGQRYTLGNNRYCSGDQDIRGRDLNTTFIVRGPDDTPFSNLDNPVICTKQFAARNGSGGSAGLYSLLTDNTVLSPEGLMFRQFFRQWVDICVDSTPEVGEYIVQVRSNAPLGSPESYDAGIDTGGHNRYSVRAGFGNSAAPAAVNSTHVGFFADGRLPIYVNQNDGSVSTNFYLARLEPLNANRTLELNFFDIGDVGNGNVTLSIIPPPDATSGGSPMTSFSNCRFTPQGYSTETLTNCTRTGMTSGGSPPFQGRIVRVLIPIPDDYNCDVASFDTGCWVRVQLSFNAGANPSDTTTWSANILGDPVRLVE